MRFPFKHEDRRKANYWIVTWLQEARNATEDPVAQRVYQSLLDQWCEDLRQAEAEHDKDRDEALLAARRGEK